MRKKPSNTPEDEKKSLLNGGNQTEVRDYSKKGSHLFKQPIILDQASGQSIEDNPGVIVRAFRAIR